MEMQIRLSFLNNTRRKKAKMKSLELKLESEIMSLQKELEENNSIVKYMLRFYKEKKFQNTKLEEQY